MLPIGEDIANQWRTLYEGGMSIEEIALDARRDPKTVRKWLHIVGTQMRPAHGHGNKSNRTNAVDGIRGDGLPNIHRVHDLGSRPRPGYRRRGRLR